MNIMRAVSMSLGVLSPGPATPPPLPAHEDALLRPRGGEGYCRMHPDCSGRRNPPPWRTETSDQNSGLLDLHSRKGKGRAANGDRSIGAASCRQEQQIQGDMPPPRPPRLGSHDMEQVGIRREVRWWGMCPSDQTVPVPIPIPLINSMSILIPVLFATSLPPIPIPHPHASAPPALAF